MTQTTNYWLTYQKDERATLQLQQYFKVKARMKDLPFLLPINPKLPLSKFLTNCHGSVFDSIVFPKWCDQVNLWVDGENYGKLSQVDYKKLFNEKATTAPFGQGEETVIDKQVRVYARLS